MGFSGAAKQDYWTPQLLTSGEGVYPRLPMGNGPALVSGQIQFAHWTAYKTEICNNIVSVSGNTAAGATPTFCGMAVYQVISDTILQLVAQSANDTTLWASTFTRYSRALNIPFLKAAGQRYALAVLCITAAAAPVLDGFNGTVVNNTSPPRLCSALAGQAGFPANPTVFTSSSLVYGEVTP